MSGLARHLMVVTRLWDEHVRTPFPDRLRGAEICGTDMVLLDADVAGCVSSWLGGRGSLDTWRQQILVECVIELDRVLPELSDERERTYHARLRDMAVLTAGV